MNQQLIRWGIIGAGKIARKFAQDLGSIDNAKLYAIASRNISKSNAFALEFNTSVAYGSYEEMVLDPNIDAIYIATPHSFHKEHTLLCLNNKIPALCEKPFAMNLQEVKSMIHLAKTNNTLLMEAMWTAFLPHFQYVIELLKNKHFGDLIELTADFGSNPNYDERSRVFDKSVGGGSLLDIGIYPVFAALSTMGLPKLIEAKSEIFPNGADSSCSMIFHYVNGTKACLKSSLTEDTKTEAVFHCEEGIIKINGRFHEPTTVILKDRHGNTELKTFDYNTIGYSYEVEHFNELIRNSKTESNIMSFERSENLIATLDKVRKIIGLDYN